MSAVDEPTATRTGDTGAGDPVGNGLAGRATRSATLARWLLRAKALRQWFLVCAIVGVLYYLAGHLALLLTNARDGVAVFWPASGVAAGAVVALGARFRWPIVVAVIVATLAANLQTRSGLALIGVFALCNGLECLLFGWIMRVLDRSHSQLENLRSVAAFLFAAAVGPAVAAVPAALAIEALTGSAGHWTGIWLTWFKSDGLGIVIVAPMIITLPSFLAQPPRPSKLLENMVAVLVAIATAYYVFGRTFAGLAPGPPPAMFLFPTFVWLAARAPAFISAVAAFLVASVIVGLVLAGEGRFGDASIPLSVRLAAAQLVLVTGCGALLTLTAMFTRINNVALALQSSEQRLKLALTAASMYAFDFDLERNLVHRTGGLLQRLGLPEVGTEAEYFATLHPDDRRKIKDMHASASPAEPQLNRLIRMHDGEGQELAIEYRSEGHFDGDGRLVRLVGICVDVTDRERSRDLLEMQASQLSGALQAGRVFAFDYDYTKRAMTRSANAADILGISQAKLADTRNLFFEMVHPGDRDELIAYGRRFSSNEAFKQKTFRIILPDGRLTWFEVTSTAIFDEAGRLKFVRGLARDVTQQTLSEQRQSTLINELDHRVKNALARMAVVVKVSRDQHQTLDAYVKVIEGRIVSMARTQERLSRNKWDGVDIEVLVAGELAPYLTPGNCRIEGPGRLLQPMAAQAFAFTLHELATNAAKHGALSRPGGRVEVVWRIDDRKAGQNMLHLTWREIVDGGVVPPLKESYGLSTIRNVLQYEQDATVALDFSPNGLVCNIVAPLQ